MSPSIKVLFRVDAGPRIGLGHLQRCLSLATALQVRGARCLFLTGGDSAVQDRVKAFGFEADRFSGTEAGRSVDLEHALEMAVRYRADVAIVDSYHAGPDYLKHVRDAGLLVVAIDDEARFSFPCQVVVNGGVHALEMPYGSSTRDTRFLLGAQYALLRPEFWDLPLRKVRETVQNVLVTLGGADPHGLMPSLLELLDDQSGDFTVTAVVGPFFENRDQIEYAARNSRRPVQLIHNPLSIRELMLEADLSICAGGQTLYELARIGCPTVAVRTAANQDGQLQAFVEAGFVRAVGRADHSKVVVAVSEAVLSLLPDAKGRAAMSAAGKGLIDGQGAMRVAAAIATEASFIQHRQVWT